MDGKVFITFSFFFFVFVNIRWFFFKHVWLEC